MTTQTPNAGMMPQAQTRTLSVNPLKRMLDENSVQKELQRSLGDNAGTFSASLIELVSTNPDLMQCEPADLVKAAMKAASLKLPINNALGLAYIVPFNDFKTRRKIPTFMVSYKGLIQLAIRSGQYKTIRSGIVYEGQYEEGDMMTGEFKLNAANKKSDKVIGYFAYLKLLNGYEQKEFKTVEEIARHAKRYSKGLGRDITVERLIEIASLPQPETNSVGWLGNFHSMARKTILRGLLSYGPMSVEMATLAEAEKDSETQDFQEVENQEAQIVDFPGQQPAPEPQPAQQQAKPVTAPF